MASDDERQDDPARRHRIHREEVLVDLHTRPRVESDRGQQDATAIGLPALQPAAAGRDGTSAAPLGSLAVRLLTRRAGIRMREKVEALFRG